MNNIKTLYQPQVITLFGIGARAATFVQIITKGWPTDGGKNDVVVTTNAKGRSVSTTKYLLLGPTGAGGTFEFSFGLYGGQDYKDWGETDSPAYLTTGAEVAGDTQRYKQVP